MGMTDEEIKAQLAHVANTINHTSPHTPSPEFPVSPLDGVDLDSVVKRLQAFVTLNKDLVLKRKDGLYLKVEAWEFLAHLLGLYPSFDSVSETVESPTSNGNAVRQYIVTTVCTLKDRNSDAVSTATMMASSHEPFLNGKQLFAVWGMSQTRAFSRAMRNIYGFIMLLAGYKALPAEELGD